MKIMLLSTFLFIKTLLYYLAITKKKLKGNIRIKTDENNNK
jgi:hypothetical protein